MSKTVEFFFDLGSPASYLAHTQLPALCRDSGATLVYRPMLLGAVFQATGNASPAMIPAKGRYMLRDLARFAERYGVPMRFNPHFPINTLTLMRLLVAVQLHLPERFDDALQALFQAIWVDGLNMGDPAKVAEAKEAESRAIGSACRHAMRAIEDCYALNPRAQKAAVFAGWREMDEYMRENKIEGVAPVVPRPEPAAKKAAADE